MSVLIALDAGHGMNTPGKRTPVFPEGTEQAGKYMPERHFNEAVVDLLKQLLIERGFDVLDVSIEDTDVPLKTRTTRANNANADYFISVHANAIGDGKNFNSTKGIETYVYKTISNDSETYRFASHIHNSLIQMTKAKDRGLKKADFHVIRETKMPAVLLECGFMTNLEEAILLTKKQYRELCAQAICKGICSFLNIPVTKQEYIQKPQEQKIQTQHWGEPFIKELLSNGLITQYHDPTENVTWAELAVLISNLYNKTQNP